ncbi:MAG: DEAD/DEAH box helicase family protein, partial [Thermoguttaceae bacterium]
MSDNSPSQTPERVNREDLEWDYLDELEFEPYPFQDQALDSWFAPKEDGKHGTLVCAPTGMGKTLIAEAAIYEALRT